MKDKEKLPFTYTAQEIAIEYMSINNDESSLPFARPLNSKNASEIAQRIKDEIASREETERLIAETESDVFLQSLSETRPGYWGKTSSEVIMNELLGLKASPTNTQFDSEHLVVLVAAGHPLIKSLKFKDEEIRAAFYVAIEENINNERNQLSLKKTRKALKELGVGRRQGFKHHMEMWKSEGELQRIGRWEKLQGEILERVSPTANDGRRK